MSHFCSTVLCATLSHHYQKRQDPFLFGVSVRDNIAYTQPGMSMEQVVAAAKLANAHEFILQLSKG
jgi:ATP-binding cassette, subfamily B, bacterial